jgi:hypothetical protein
MSVEPQGRTFDRLTLHEWRQLRDVDLVFHPRLTVITGANAAGKTTILNLLSRHFGWPSQFVGVPERPSKGGLLRYLISWRRWLDRDNAEEVIGTLTYSDRATSDITVPAQTESALYTPQFRALQFVKGLYLTSHRPIAVYQPVASIPTALASREQILEQHINEHRTRHQGVHSGSTPTFRLKEALTALGILGTRSDVLAGNPEAAALYEDFQSVLRQMLPSSLGFSRFAIDPPEVVLETRTGRFALDAISGGMQAIIDLAWQVFLRADDSERFVVMVDEPENHLHPELQRTLLPGMLAAFPQAQFIVATHNPFVVTSVPDSHVYALRYTDVTAVEAILLAGANKAGSSNEVLRDVLGLDSTIPLWVEHKLDELVDRYAESDAGDLHSLRAELNALGMGAVFTDAVHRFLDARE